MEDFEMERLGPRAAYGDAAIQELVKADLSSLKLLLVSGWRMIGSQQEKGVLYEDLHSGAARIDKIEVLLLDPSCEVAGRRAAKMGLTWEQYQNGVRAVLHTLRQLRDTARRPIEVFYYDEEPIWQMVITKFEIWLFCAAADIPAERSPMYCLRREAEYGLAVGFKAVWDRRRASAVPVRLEDVGPPEWPQLKHVPRRQGAA